MALSKAQHQRLFARYINNLNIAHLRAIQTAFEQCAVEQLNGNANSQAIADNNLNIAINFAIKHMLPADLAAVDAIINETR